MSRTSGPRSIDVPDWDAIYREGTPAWETGEVAGELARMVDQGHIEPCGVLELGCGTGADAVYLARKGFDVTAVDSSPMALERARRRAQLEGAGVCFVLDDVFEFARNSEPFDLIYDAGFYHFIRRVDLDGFLDLLWRVTRPGSLYLTLCGSDEEEADGGPPQVSQEELRFELTRLFEIVKLRRFCFESPNRSEGYRGWSCLLKRPEGLGV